MKPISILAGAFAALSLSFSAASADTRAIYTISNISVDEEAQNTRQAEAEAFATAKVEGLQRLVRKITLPEDRDGIGNSFYSYATANELASAVDVDNEKRSSTVYRADLSVVFNPVRVRSRLQQLGVPYVDRQSPPSLIVPVSEDSSVLEGWREAWPRADRGALNPYVTGLSFYKATDNWSAVSSEVRASGASDAVFAELSGAEGSYRVRLTRVSGGDSMVVGMTGAVATIEDAMLAATEYLDTVWKRQAIVRSSERTTSSATVRYSNLQTWAKLRAALSSSALVSDFQVDAISRDGALVTFRYAGDDTRLAGELRQRGVILTREPSGWVMESALGG